MADAERLTNVYYSPDNVGSFGSAKTLAQAAGTSIKTAQNWLSTQLVYTLHKPARTRYVTRPYRTNKIDSQWQADLVEMNEFEAQNDAYKYLLTVIDVFSRYAWVRALRSKGAKDVTDAFQNIISGPRKCKTLQTDNGKEFENASFQRLLRDNDIKFFTISSVYKAAVVERFNRTLKSKMWKFFTHTGRHRWIDVLPRLVTTYNNSVHRSIAIAPINVRYDNEMRLWERQQNKGPQRVTQRDAHTILRVGDTVRLSHVKKVFNKGYLPAWTDQVYTITKVIQTPKIERQFAGPVQYKIKDYNDDEIEGAFYGFELQKIAPPERYRVENVIRERVRNGIREYFVKWLGYGPEFNSWVRNLEAI